MMDVEQDKEKEDVSEPEPVYVTPKPASEVLDVDTVHAQAAQTPKRRLMKSRSRGRRISRPRSTELIKVIKVEDPTPEGPDDFDAEEVFEIPQYKYQPAPDGTTQALKRRDSFLHQQREDELLKLQIKDIQMRRENEEFQKVVEADVTKLVQRKKEIGAIVRKDMRDQSENIKQRLAQRKRRVASAQRQDITGVKLQGITK